MSKQRSIPKIPFKVLDAPSLGDDFYLNLVDWSSRNDLVVGLSNCTYIWSASSSKVTKLHDFGNNNSVTSVQWAHRGQYLAVGTHSGIV
jgi:cell division cycle 20-like protein 1 (cofactor of APC complex)